MDFLKGPSRGARDVFQFARRQTQKVSKFSIGVLIAFTIIFLFRYLSINSQPAPPSEDLGGDLIVLHSYTEPNAIFPYFRFEAPPLYYFLIVMPLTGAFGTMIGLKVIDALVPTILLFPFYFLSKAITSNRLASVLGASLFAFSEAFNEMLGWGGTLNMFAFTFAIASLYFLIRLLTEPTLKNGGLSAVFISLTVGTHHLTAIYLGLVALLSFGMSYLIGLRPRLPPKILLTTIGLAAVLSVPYLPYYVSLGVNSINIGPTYTLTPLSIVRTLVYTNARTNPSVFLLLTTAVAGLIVCARKTELRPGIIIVGASAMATVALTLFLNSAIYDRAAYFLPITLFAGVAAFLGLVENVFRTNHARFVKLIAVFVISLTMIGFAIGDVNRFQTAVGYYQIVDSQTLDALNWISSHTLRNDTIYTNYPGLAAWIAGYAERTELFPRATGFVLTAPDYKLATAANAIDAGNYVLTSQSVTVGDFFPSSIYNPAVYLNSLSGKHGLLFFDDDYNSMTFTDRTGTRSTNLVSAFSKDFAGYSEKDATYSAQFNYSWTFARGNRVISLVQPSTLQIHFAMSAENSTATSFVSRIMAFSGENFSYESLGADHGIVKATLQTGEQLSFDISASSIGGSPKIGFSLNDPMTLLPTLVIQTEGLASSVDLNIMISLSSVTFGRNVTFSYAFNVLKDFNVHYLVLDARAYAQQIRFAKSQVTTTVVFSNSKIVILNI